MNIKPILITLPFPTCRLPVIHGLPSTGSILLAPGWTFWLCGALFDGQWSTWWTDTRVTWNFSQKGKRSGGFGANIFHVHPGGNDPIWRSYSSNGLVQPPPRKLFQTFLVWFWLVFVFCFAFGLCLFVGCVFRFEWKGFVMFPFLGGGGRLIPCCCCSKVHDGEDCWLCWLVDLPPLVPWTAGTKKNHPFVNRKIIWTIHLWFFWASTCWSKKFPFLGVPLSIFVEAHVVQWIHAALGSLLPGDRLEPGTSITAMPWGFVGWLCFEDQLYTHLGEDLYINMYCNYIEYIIFTLYTMFALYIHVFRILSDVTSRLKGLDNITCTLDILLIWPWNQSRVTFWTCQFLGPRNLADGMKVVDVMVMVLLCWASLFLWLSTRVFPFSMEAESRSKGISCWSR